MIKYYKIDAVDSIKKRVLKSNLDKDSMVSLYKELQNAGYEDENINLETCRIIYEAGDTILITRKQFNSLPDRRCKKLLKMVYGDNPPDSMIGTITNERADRHGRYYQHVKWHIATLKNENRLNETMAFPLEELGFEFKPPEYNEIPIGECDDEMLNDDERVIKYLMIGNGWSETQAEEYLKPICKAMKKAECVMYRP